MSTTTKQDQDFVSLIDGEITFDVNKKVLSSAIDWIADNLNPDDVFSQKDLENWAENNGYENADEK